MSYRILTVCTGNICRSPMAEVMIREAADALDADVAVDSAAITGWETGSGMDERALATLREHGSSGGTDIRARKVTDSDFADNDLILAMDTDHYRFLRATAPDAAAKEKVRMFRSFDPRVADAGVDEQGIADPWYGGDEDFETTWQEIDAAIPGILRHAQANGNPG